MRRNYHYITFENHVSTTQCIHRSIEMTFKFNPQMSRRRTNKPDLMEFLQSNKIYWDFSENIFNCLDKIERCTLVYKVGMVMTESEWEISFMTISPVPIYRSWMVFQWDFQKQYLPANLFSHPVLSHPIPFISYRIAILLMSVPMQRAQYSWPPCSKEPRSLTFCIANIIYHCYKTRYPNEGVDCTEPSLQPVFTAPSIPNSMQHISKMGSKQCQPFYNNQIAKAISYCRKSQAFETWLSNWRFKFVYIFSVPLFDRWSFKKGVLHLE